MNCTRIREIQLGYQFIVPKIFANANQGWNCVTPWRIALDSPIYMFITL